MRNWFARLRTGVDSLRPGRPAAAADSAIYRRDRDLTCLHQAGDGLCIRTRKHEGAHEFVPADRVIVTAPPPVPRPS